MGDKIRGSVLKPDACNLPFSPSFENELLQEIEPETVVATASVSDKIRGSVLKPGAGNLPFTPFFETEF